MDGEQLQGSQWAKAGRRICGEYTVVLDAFQMDQVLWVAENLVRIQATARDSEANSMIAFWLVMIRQI